MLVFILFQLLSCVWLFATPWTAACQAPVSSTISWSWLKFMSIESVSPSVSSVSQLSHPLLSPSPTLNLSQHLRLLQ